MKSVLLATLLATSAAGSSRAQCTGNCTDGFGALTANGNVSIGFFKTGKLSGLGDESGKQLHSGEWKDGKKDGLVVYNETGDFGFGLFRADQKEGMHLILLKDGGIRLTTYEKGQVKKNEVPAKTSSTACPYGNCSNGIGYQVGTEGAFKDKILAGRFSNGLLNGPGYIRDLESGNQVYSIFKEGMVDKVMIYIYPDGGATLAEISNGKKHGKVINIFANGRFMAQQYADDVAVSKY